MKLLKLCIIALIGTLLTTLKQFYTGNQNILNLTWTEIKINQTVENIYYLLIVILIFIFINALRRR